MQIGGVHRSLTSINVCLGGIDPLCAFEDLPERKQQKVDWDPNIGGDEVVNNKGMEGVKSIEEDDNGEKD